MNLRMGLNVVVIGCAMLAAPAVSLAYTIGDVAIEDWAGAGANEAVCVVDFGPGANYAFGYRWDGDATGEDMLVALDAETALSVAYSYDPTWGFALSGFTYGANRIVSDGWVTTYPAYWWSGTVAWDEDVWGQVPPDSGNWEIVETISHPAVAPDGETWQYGTLGASSRELADGLFDGWTQGTIANGALAPVTPVPEPATLALLAIAGLGVLARRRTK